MTAVLPELAATFALLPAISLDDITAEADLQTRVDRKYLLPPAVIADVVCEAHPAARMLEIDGEREFPYSSTYFDTTELRSFHGAVGRRRRRFKVRTRRYGDQQCYLEVKTRDGRGRSVKHRSPHPFDHARDLRDDDLDVIERTLASAGINDTPLRRALTMLLPVVDTAYTRCTVFLPGDAARVTVDQSVSWSDPAGRELQLMDLAIVETKSSRAASSVDRALWRRGYRPRSLSKYATGMTLLFPELPSNRWHRLRAQLTNQLRVVVDIR